MLRVIVTGCDDPGAADKVTTHVFLRRPDDCIEYMDAMLSPRCMSVGTNTMRKQVAFAMVFRYLSTIINPFSNTCTPPN